MNATEFEPKSVLIAEDEEDLLFIYESLLTDAGFVVETAENGRKAIEKIKAKNYQYIICDVNMPEVDGLGVYAYVAKNKPNTHFVFVTGHAQGTREFAEVEKSGVPVLRKPLDFDQLIKTLESSK